MSSSVGHGKFHGVAGLYIIRQVLTDDDRKSDVDGISIEDPREGFRNNSLYAESL